MAIIPADEKVFMVDKRTNTTYGGSQALQDMQQWYTMQDVADSVQPYKVFTALLTQGGGDDPQDANGITLTVGVTYQINNNSGGADFTIVGAPNNEIGTKFIATGTTPNWGDDVADLSWNNGAPVVTVLENTIGNIWFTYNSVGNYSINSNGLFINNKTTAFISSGAEGILNGILTGTNYSNQEEIYINTAVLPSPTSLDGELDRTPFEIRVYN